MGHFQQQARRRQWRIEAEMDRPRSGIKYALGTIIP
jgi:hypothetical protein